MATFYTALTTRQRELIAQQSIFFTASAHSSGRVNVSPKGMDSFRVLDDQAVAYLDMYGSGNETAAHLQHDGRLTIMFCSFAEAPLIVRLYGRGEVVAQGSERWASLAEHFTLEHGLRQIIVLNIESTQESCGYGVPRFELLEERQTLRRHTERISTEELRQKHALQTASIDGLPISS